MCLCVYVCQFQLTIEIFRNVLQEKPWGDLPDGSRWFQSIQSFLKVGLIWGGHQTLIKYPKVSIGWLSRTSWRNPWRSGSLSSISRRPEKIVSFRCMSSAMWNTSKRGLTLHVLLFHNLSWKFSWRSSWRSRRFFSQEIESLAFEEDSLSCCRHFTCHWAEQKVTTRL